MAEAGFWVAWGLPTQGRERQALDLLNESRVYLARLAQDEQIERFDIAILKPQTTELGGFVLIQGTQEQIDSLRRDNDFQRWVTQVQLVADRVGIVDAVLHPDERLLPVGSQLIREGNGRFRAIRDGPAGRERPRIRAGDDGLPVVRARSVR